MKNIYLNFFLIFHKFLKYIFQNFYFEKKVQIIFENLEIDIFRN